MRLLIPRTLRRVREDLLQAQTAEIKILCFGLLMVIPYGGRIAGNLSSLRRGLDKKAKLTYK